MFTDHKPLETQTKRQDKTMNRLTEAFLRYNFDIKYKKGSEMPADFLGRNAIDAVGIFDQNWIAAQEQDKYCEIVKTAHGNDQGLQMQTIRDSQIMFYG